MLAEEAILKAGEEKVKAEQEAAVVNLTQARKCRPGVASWDAGFGVRRSFIGVGLWFRRINKS